MTPIIPVIITTAANTPWGLKVPGTEVTALHTLSTLIFTIVPQQVSRITAPVFQMGKPRHKRLGTVAGVMGLDSSQIGTLPPKPDFLTTV